MLAILHTMDKLTGCFFLFIEEEYSRSVPE